MKTITKCLTALGCLLIFFFFMACHKENSVNSSSANNSIPKGESKVSVHIMDGPVQFDKVLIDIIQVAVLVDTATSQSAPDYPNQWDLNYCGWGRGPNNKSLIWDTLSISAGIYNLMQLRNGTDSLLGSGLYVTGKILKIRITLGDSNSVYTDSTTSYPLVVFGPNPYFDINVSREDVSAVTNNEFETWLDFNLEKSVFFWNGTFLLKPDITIFNDIVSAKISGQVLPYGVASLVTVYNAADTLYAIPFWNGAYLIRGVPAGAYSINFKGTNGFQDTTINNIVVDSMKTTQVPTVTLHQ